MPFSSVHAFHALLMALRPNVICDVGSCDGQQALAFKRQMPNATVIAFEANPDNYERICSDDDLRRRDVDVRHLAVSDEVGTASFYALEQREDLPWAKGASSLNKRRPEERHGLLETEYQVPTTTLGAELADTSGTIALWIDVEGAALRAVRGMEQVAARVVLVHIEVELSDVVQIWEGQAPAHAVLDALAEQGFRVVGRASDWPGQENVVLVRRDQSGRERVLTSLALTSSKCLTAAKAARHSVRKRVAALRA